MRPLPLKESAKWGGIKNAAHTNSVIGQKSIRVKRPPPHPPAIFKSVLYRANRCEDVGRSRGKDEFLKGHSIALTHPISKSPSHLSVCPCGGFVYLPDSLGPAAGVGAPDLEKKVWRVFFFRTSYVRFHTYGKVEPKKEKKIPHSAVGLGWTPGVWRRSCPWKTSCRGQEEDEG